MKFEDLCVYEKIIKDIRDTSKEKSRLVSEKKRQGLLGKQNVDPGRKDSNIEEKNKNANENNVDIEAIHTDDSADSAEIELLSKKGDHKTALFISHAVESIQHAHSTRSYFSSFRF